MQEDFEARKLAFVQSQAEFAELKREFYARMDRSRVVGRDARSGSPRGHTPPPPQDEGVGPRRAQSGAQPAVPVSQASSQSSSSSPPSPSPSPSPSRVVRELAGARGGDARPPAKQRAEQPGQDARPWKPVAEQLRNSRATTPAPALAPHARVGNNNSNNNNNQQQQQQQQQPLTTSFKNMYLSSDRPLNFRTSLPQPTPAAPTPAEPRRRPGEARRDEHNQKTRRRDEESPSGSRPSRSHDKRQGSPAESSQRRRGRNEERDRGNVGGDGEESMAVNEFDPLQQRSGGRRRDPGAIESFGLAPPAPRHERQTRRENGGAGLGEQQHHYQPRRANGKSSRSPRQRESANGGDAQPPVLPDLSEMGDDNARIQFIRGQPIFGNPWVVDGAGNPLANDEFKEWTEAGFSVVGDLYSGGNKINYDEIYASFPPYRARGAVAQLDAICSAIPGEWRDLLWRTSSEA